MAALRMSKSLRTKCCLLSAGLRSSQLPRYVQVVKAILYLSGYVHGWPSVTPRFIIDVFVGYVMRSVVVFVLENYIYRIPRFISGEFGPPRYSSKCEIPV